MASVADLVVRITSDVKDAQAGVEGLGDTTSKAQAGIRSAALPAAAALAAVGVAAVAAGNAAAEDAQSQALLATSLKNSTGASAAAVAAVEDHISAMSKATGVADDELRPAMGTLVRATGDVTTAQSALDAALDISAATGKSVESVSAALAKGYAGQTTSIGRLVPGLDAATLASGDMNAIMAELAETTGGSAAAAAGTAAGQMKIMQTAMGEAQEEIGTALLPMMSALATALAAAAGFAMEHSTATKVLIGIFVALASAIVLANVALSVSATVTGVAKAAQASYAAQGIVFRAVELGRAAATGIATAATTVATVAVRALGIALAFATGPIGLVIIGVTLIVAALVLLYTRSETVRRIVDAAFAAIASAAQSAAKLLSSAWEAATTAMGQAFQAAGDVVRNVGDTIQSGWGSTIGAVKSAMSGLADILSAPFDAMASAIDWVMGKVDSLIGALSRIHVPDINLPGPFSLPAPATFTAPATTGVAAPRVAGLGSRAAGASGGGGISITVNGALDPEATARQIRRILAGHDRRMGLTG